MLEKCLKGTRQQNCGHMYLVACLLYSVALPSLAVIPHNCHDASNVTENFTYFTKRVQDNVLMDSSYE